MYRLFIVCLHWDMIQTMPSGRERYGLMKAFKNYMDQEVVKHRRLINVKELVDCHAVLGDCPSSSRSLS